MVAPDMRRLALSLASVGLVFGMMLQAMGLEINANSVFPDINDLARLPWFRLLLAVTGMLFGLYCAVIIARNFEKLPALVRSFPLITLHALMWGIMALSTVPGFGILMMIPTLSWVLSYLALQSRRRFSEARRVLESRSSSSLDLR